jgi:uncharacterized protein (DUF849 family)
MYLEELKEEILKVVLDSNGVFENMDVSRVIELAKLCETVKSDSSDKFQTLLDEYDKIRERMNKLRTTGSLQSEADN